jgi:hypothetical protein
LRLAFQRVAPIATYGSGSYNVVGLTSQLGLGRGGAHLAAWSVGLAVLAVAAHRRSFTLALAASMVLARSFGFTISCSSSFRLLCGGRASPSRGRFRCSSGSAWAPARISGTSRSGWRSASVVFVLSSRPRFGASALSLPEPSANAV